MVRFTGAPLTRNVIPAASAGGLPGRSLRHRSWCVIRMSGDRPQTPAACCAGEQMTACHIKVAHIQAPRTERSRGNPESGGLTSTCSACCNVHQINALLSL
jgi:hypothetical protein